ncbi:MAG: sigma-54-dependent Fis family transcriptional regulator [Planctomycetes bacterium]|nr:sigma-54-dependent Fis family transcriptional regulator [Planctomycetota bacterium]
MARILVVDDTDQNLALVQLYLRGTEFEVEVASGGQEALARCRERSFDVILLDVVMPEIDGLEVCRRLKEDPRTAFVPVIFLTGRIGDESEKVTAYRLGAVDYIQKPINRDELVARIRVMLQLEQARSQLDRENAALRRQLEARHQELTASADLLRELQQLRREYAAALAPTLLVLDAERTVLAADAGVAALLGDVVPGRRLEACGHAAARLARLVQDGARAVDLTLPVDGGEPRIVQVDVRRGADGASIVLLHDLGGVRATEQRIAAREPFAVVEPRVGALDYAMTDFVGSSPVIASLAAKVARLRQTRSTVLIHGESGTGKELVARALHFDGQNRSAPFIPIHCGAIAPELIESELFGHERGAFTGAQQAREGLFRVADGGTIFLDEIAETSPSLQVKLLRVLQRGEIRPVGASQPLIVDVRILAATNRDLLQMVREGRFREDLYYRLEVVTLHLPPLRERLEDLPALVDHLLRLGNRRHDRLSAPVRAVSRGAMERLLAYPWPGNVRELENVVERAFALGVGAVLQVEDLPEHVVRGTPTLGPAAFGAAVEDTNAPDVTSLADLRQQREVAERRAILRALRDLQGDKVAAAQQLGMSRSTFYRRLKELGL